MNFKTALICSIMKFELELKLYTRSYLFSPLICIQYYFALADVRLAFLQVRSALSRTNFVLTHSFNETSGLGQNLKLY